MTSVHPEPGPERIAFRLKEAAESLGVSLRTLTTWISEGEIPVSRKGRVLLVLKRDLERFVEKHRVTRWNLQ